VDERSAHDRFTRLLARLGGLSLEDATREAAMEAELYSPRPRQPRPKTDGERYFRQEHNRLLGGLMFWLYQGGRPSGLELQEFQLLKPLCEAFVQKRQMEAEDLAAFEDRKTHKAT
jgi:hypothetical protein